MVPWQAIIQASQEISASNADRMLGNAMEGTRADGIQDFSTVNRAANRGIAANILTGNIGKAIGLSSQKKAMRRQIREERKRYNTKTMNTMIATDDTGLKDGGEVKDGDAKTSKGKGGKLSGKGGPKDDAIPAKLNRGDIVIPADADQEIVDYILKRIGLDRTVDEDAAASGSGKNVKLSNQETIIPAAMAEKAEEAADELGISLADLMPNAEQQPEEDGEYAKGLLGDLKVIGNGQETVIANTKKMEGRKFSGTLKPTTATTNDSPRGLLPSKGVSEGKGGFGKFLSENADTLIGTAQMGIGAAMAAGMGKRPKADASDHMAALANKVSAKRTKNIAEYKVASEEAIEAKRRMGVDNAVRITPGAASAISSAQEANSQWASDKNDTNKAVAVMSNDGLNLEADLEAKSIEMKQRSMERDQDYHDKKAEGVAKLIGTGMQNTIDGVRYKHNRKALEEIAKLRDYDALLELVKKSK